MSPVAQSASLEMAEHVHLPRGGTPPKTRPPRWEVDGVTAGATYQADAKSVGRMDLRTASVPARRIRSRAAWKGAESDGATWLREH